MRHQPCFGQGLIQRLIRVWEGRTHARGGGGGGDVRWCDRAALALNGGWCQCHIALATPRHPSARVPSWARWGSQRVEGVPGDTRRCAGGVMDHSVDS